MIAANQTQQLIDWQAIVMAGVAPFESGSECLTLFWLLETVLRPVCTESRRPGATLVPEPNAVASAVAFGHSIPHSICCAKSTDIVVECIFFGRDSLHTALKTVSNNNFGTFPLSPILTRPQLYSVTALNCFWPTTTSFMHSDPLSIASGQVQVTEQPKKPPLARRPMAGKAAATKSGPVVARAAQSSPGMVNFD